LVQEFKKFKRDQVMDRLSVSKQTYVDSLNLTLKLFSQSLETGQDVEGNPLKQSELDLMESFKNKIEAEIASAESNS